MTNANISGLLESGAASRAAPGELLCGDMSLVQEHGGGALIGVVDGAGHGSGAASVAQTAIALLKESAGEPVNAILERCHDGLRRSRGAAVSVAAFDAAASRIVWSGVGNVEGALLSRDDASGGRHESLMLRNGVVGYRFAAPRVSSLPVHAGDLLIFITDGIESGFLEGIDFRGPAQAVADAILGRHAKGTDDALVLAVRFVGGAQ